MFAGIVACVVYGLVLICLQRLSGVRYTDIASSESNLRRGALIPVAICAIALVAIMAATGRLADAFTYAPRADSAVLWAVPAVIVVGAVVRLVRNDWSHVGKRFVAVALVTSILVGISEELLVRGFLVDVLQENDLAVIWIAIVSSLVFGVIHGLNALNGQAVGSTLAQVVANTIVGIGLFACLAVSGTLWLPIAMHALFDFSLLAQGKISDKSQAHMVDVILVGGMYVLSLAALFFL